MHFRPRSPSAGSSLLMLLACLPAMGGCGLLFGGTPDSVNIQLRKDKQALQERVEKLEARAEADARTIAGLRSERPTTPTLPTERLDRLYTTHGLKFGRLTGGWDRDLRVPGDEGIAVYVVPLDGDGQPLKAAGAFKVEAFDLGQPDQPLVGTWEFDVPAAKATWRGAFLDYNYVLECPWQKATPAHDTLTVKVTFLDELTQVPFTLQQQIKIDLPPTTPPAAPQAAGAP
jgi:hypothetical protein